MKPNFYTIILLIGFQAWPDIAYSLDKEDCVELMSDSGNAWVARAMYVICLSEDSYFFNRSKKFRCIKKASDAKTEIASKVIFSECMKK